MRTRVRLLAEGLVKQDADAVGSTGPGSVTVRPGDSSARPARLRRRREGSAAPSTSRRVAGLLRRHIVVVSLLVAGAVLRLLVLVTFRPALAFLQDSYDYLLNSRSLRPEILRPLLYPLALRIVGEFRSMELVVVLQHLSALVAAVLLYATLCRVGVRRWLAACAVAPLLLDAYQVDIEHFVLSESLFQLLLVVSVACLLWRPDPSPRLLVGAGLALAGVALTRTVGLPLVIPAFLLLVTGRVPWRRYAVFGLAAGLPLVAYAGWFASVNGFVGLQGYNGMMLASRAMTIADCRNVPMPSYERPLCVTAPVKQRQTSDWYAMDAHSPLRNLQIPAGQRYDAVARDFALRILSRQPGDYARMIKRDLAHYFAPGRSTTRKNLAVSHWQFAHTQLPGNRYIAIKPLSDPYRGGQPVIGHPSHAGVALYGLRGEQMHPSLWKRGRSWLSSYQAVAFTPGPLLAACLGIGLVAGIGRLPTELRRLRRISIFFAVCGLGLLLATTLSAVFEYRYLLPVLPLLPPAGAVGVELLLSRRSVRLGARDAATSTSPAVTPVSAAARV